MITGNEPAMPHVHGNDNYNVSPGLTINQHFAAMALQGLLANSNYKLVYNPKEVLENCAKDAVIAADTLIAELNKPK